MRRIKILAVAHFFKKNVRNKDFIGVEWRRSEKKGDLYALNPPKEEDGDKEPLQFWKRKDNRTLSLREIARIKTLHSVDNFLGREDMSYAAPLYSEVLEQIPKNIFPKVFAFEVLVDDFSREMSDGPDGYDKYDKITTVLYEKIKL